MPDSAITATNQTAIARRPSASRVSFSASAENRPVRLISRVSAASARPMRRLIANGGWVPAVKISTAAVSVLAKVHSQPAEIQLINASVTSVMPKARPRCCSFSSPSRKAAASAAVMMCRALTISVP